MTPFAISKDIESRINEAEIERCQRTGGRRCRPVYLVSPLDVTDDVEIATPVGWVDVQRDPDCPRGSFARVEPEMAPLNTPLANQAARTATRVEAAIRTMFPHVEPIPSSLYAERDALRRSAFEYGGIVSPAALAERPKGKYVRAGYTRAAQADAVLEAAQIGAITGEHARELLGAIELDPLDVEYDGHPLRWLLKMDTKARQENVTAQCTRSCFTPAQRAAVSAHLSAELRAKVAAGKSAAKEREVSVRCDGDWLDEVEW